MTIRKERLTPSQARELIARGYTVTLVRLLCGEHDEYEVSVS